MNKKSYYVSIVRYNKKDDFLHIRCNGYEKSIPTSYIVENNLTIDSANMVISKELYENWFKEEIEAEQEEDRKEQEEQRKEQETYDLFFLNIPLFVKNREMILKEPRYYSIVTPIALSYYTTRVGVTLGELLQIWENEIVFSVTCRALRFFKRCGGQAVVFSYGGSYMSGALIKSSVCLKCGKIKHHREGFLSQMRKSHSDYSPIEPRAANPASLEELVEACKYNTNIK